MDNSGPSLIPYPGCRLAMHPPIPDPVDRIRSIANGFELGQAFYTAHEMDIFSHLTRPTSAEELSWMIGSEISLTGVLLDILASSEVLKKEKDRYWLSEEFRPFLLKNSPHYAHYLSFASVRRSLWWNMKSRLQKKAVPQGLSEPYQEGRSSIISIGHEAMRGRLQETMKILIHEPVFTSAKQILDLGGGHALFSISSAQEVPDAMITYFDRADICPVARDLIRYAKVESRIRICEGDFFVDPIGSGYDVILDLGAFGGDYEMTGSWYKKMKKALSDGGLYVRSTFTLDNTRTGPALTLLFEMEEFLSGRRNLHLTNEETIRLLEKAGFHSVRIIDLGETLGVPLRIILGLGG